MGVRWQKKDALYKRLRTTVPGITEALTEVNRSAASEIVDMAKGLVAVGTEDAVHVRDTIRSSPANRETAFVVEAGGPATTTKGPNGPYDYAVGLEFGTIDTPAQPFFWPSYRVTAKRHKGRVGRAVGKVLKKAQS